MHARTDRRNLEEASKHAVLFVRQRIGIRLVNTMRPRPWQLLVASLVLALALQLQVAATSIPLFVPINMHGSCGYLRTENSSGQTFTRVDAGGSGLSEAEHYVAYDAADAFASAKQRSSGGSILLFSQLTGGYCRLAAVNGGAGLGASGSEPGMVRLRKMLPGIKRAPPPLLALPFGASAGSQQPITFRADERVGLLCDAASQGQAARLQVTSSGLSYQGSPLLPSGDEGLLLLQPGSSPDRCSLEFSRGEWQPAAAMVWCLDYAPCSESVCKQHLK